LFLFLLGKYNILLLKEVMWK